jgi:hypothetical protein
MVLETTQDDTTSPEKPTVRVSFLPEETVPPGMNGPA